MINRLGLFIVLVIFVLIQTGCAEQSTREHNRRADFYSGI